MVNCHGEKSGSTKEIVRVAAMADVHSRQTSQGTLKTLFSQVGEDADILLICGDLTDYGLPGEARILAEELSVIAGRMPILAVLGNHDHQAGRQAEVSDILSDSGVIVFDGNGCEFLGIGFTGVKGFGGGFGKAALQPWGEDSIKQFVASSVQETVKLESGLAKLQTERRIVLLHYSPIRDTVVGESPEIFPFLGSSRLEDPLNHYPVIAAFHGHAHKGSLEACTSAGVPVYNVAMPLLRRTFPARPPFRIIEIPLMKWGDACASPEPVSSETKTVG
jgi:Icc-related predicted phosphoesterase